VQSRQSASSASVWVLVPDGRLDASVAPELDQAICTLERQGVTQIVLSFCNTHYISSSSLRIMLVHWRKLRQAGGGLKVCCLPEKIAKVLGIAGFDTVFPSYLDEDLAAQAFSQDAHSEHGDDTSPS
jgi:anti-sigma B factor antagonist